jgi:hypothetical protein
VSAETVTATDVTYSFISLTVPPTLQWHKREQKRRRISLTKLGLFLYKWFLRECHKSNFRGSDWENMVAKTICSQNIQGND